MYGTVFYNLLDFFMDFSGMIELIPGIDYCFMPRVWSEKSPGFFLKPPISMKTVAWILIIEA